MTAATFTITHVITEDGADGQPWPPDSTDFWAVAAGHFC
jgi:hypothetical protein